MRVGFFGQSGPYSPVALRYLLAHQEGLALALVVEGRKKRPGQPEHRLLTPQRGPLPAGDDLAALASAAGIAVLTTRDVNDAAAVALVRERALDVLVCVGFDRLFSPALLATATLGGINAHPSLLPALRGPSPIFWALRRGDRELGVTSHGLDPHEDHGPIYGARRFVRPSRASGEALFARAAETAGPLVVQSLALAAGGTFVGSAQDHALATRAPRPAPRDFLIEAGEWTCEHALDFACAAAYFGGARVRLDDGDVLLARGVDADLGARLSAPCARRGDRMAVQCRDGVAYFEIDHALTLTDR